MARKDVINYYISVQNQYFEMLNDAKDLDDAYKNGIISQEQVEQAQDILSKLKENYDRLSYVVLLLNEPGRDSKKKSFKKQNIKVYDYLKNSNDCYIRNENEDVLKKLKSLIKGESDGK